MSKEVIYIFIGGGTGSALRYFIQLLMHERIVPYHFPWATFTVNLLGSFLIGLFYALSERFHLPFEVRLFLTTGLCGGFTTFSTFSSDGVGLLKGEFYGAFVLYTLLSIGIGLAATLAGGYVGKQIYLISATLLSSHDTTVFFAIFMKSLKTSVCHESLGRTFQA